MPRRKRNNQALVVGSLVVLVVALAILGTVLVVANRGGRESAGGPTDSAASASGFNLPNPDSPPTGSAEGSAAEKWFDAAESTIQRKDVSVRVVSATVGGPRMIQEALDLPGKPKRSLLLIVVELKNVSADLRMEHRGWNGYGRTPMLATLSDNSGKPCRPIRFRGVGSGKTPPPADLGPNERTEDLLVFNPPAEDAKFLELRLPAAAFGRSGELCFRIPREMIAVAEDPAEPQDASGPAEGGVPAIDRGIADVEAQQQPDSDTAGPTQQRPDAESPDARPRDDDPDGDISAIERGIEELGGGDPDPAEEGPSDEGEPDDARPPRRENDR